VSVVYTPDPLISRKKQKVKRTKRVRIRLSTLHRTRVKKTIGSMVRKGSAQRQLERLVERDNQKPRGKGKRKKRKT